MVSLSLFNFKETDKLVFFSIVFFSPSWPVSPSYIKSNGNIIRKRFNIPPVSRLFGHTFQTASKQSGKHFEQQFPQFAFKQCIAVRKICYIHCRHSLNLPTLTRSSSILFPFRVSYNGKLRILYYPFLLPPIALPLSLLYSGQKQLCPGQGVFL